MLVLPIITPLLQRDSDLAQEILKAATLEPGDILVVSSKALARTESAEVDLSSMKPSAEATKLAKECEQNPKLVEFVLREIKRMNGSVIGVSPYSLLTAVKPKGMKGRILCPNAGVDQSNIEKGKAIGWPHDPVASVKKLSTTLKTPVILSDSCCTIGRSGVTAFALVCCGIEPFRSEVGHTDLFGKTMRLTQEAVADQLATAANAVMGNATQSAPAAIIRGFSVATSDFCGWVPGMDPTEDLYRDILKA